MISWLGGWGRSPSLAAVLVWRLEQGLLEYEAEGPEGEAMDLSARGSGCGNNKLELAKMQTRLACPQKARTDMTDSIDAK